MKQKLLNKKTNNLIANEIIVAQSFLARAKGLLMRAEFEKDKVLWIKNCNSIHTFFMKFSIDVIFVDSQLRVKAIYKNLRPWRFVWPVWRASSVFELAEGVVQNVKIGDQLYVDS